MRVLIQRSLEAQVVINNESVAAIERGMVILLGITHEDTEEDIEWLCNKIIKLRIYDDQDGVMNQSILDTNGEFIVVSQFTLQASTKKGNRPSYIKAAKPDIAIPLYEKFVARLKTLSSRNVQTGQFGADMKVKLCNDGPVTIWIDSKTKE